MKNDRDTAMNNEDIDSLLARGFAGTPPRAAFRAAALQTSQAALARVRSRRTRWRIVPLAAAAVLIATLSFLGGRYSMPRSSAGPTPVEPQVVADDGTVAVPNDLVAWLDAARLFRRLGMEERMARAVDRAGRLLPVDAVAAYGGPAPAFTADSEVVRDETNRVSPRGVPIQHQSFENVNRILAQSFGD